jgi:ATP-dependent DNA helicase DinG
LGQRCPLYDECFVERAKARAKAADVIVVNHALLLRDASLRAMTQGHTHILPDATVCVIDEAHRLEEVAADSLGVEVTVWRWRRAKERFEQLTVYATELDTDWAAQAARMVAPAHAIGDLLEQAIAGIEERMLRQQIGTQRLQQEPLLAGAAHLLRSFAQQFSAAPPPWLATIPDPRKLLKRCGEWRALGRSITRLADDLTAIAAGDDANVLRYAELTGVAGRQHVKLLAKFIDVAPLLRRLLYTPTVVTDEDGEEKTLGYASVVHTSATLTTGDGFTSWRRRIGLDSAEELAVPSPFDYPRQALLYLPQDGAAFDPSQDFKSGGSGPYFGRLCTEIEALVRASSGRAFLLFASGKMMRRVYDEIAYRLPYTKLVQGEMPRPELIKRFKESGHAVLFGLKSFWEGIDIQGEALSLVVIDKLPFGMPDDPLWSARCDAITRRGGSWFGELALPQATIALKQATGRLIRTRQDHGVVAVLDGRLSTKAYGQQIIKALPPFARTHSLSAVQAFFRATAA